MTRHLQDAQESEVAVRYRAGEHITALARIFGVGRQVIRNALRRQGIRTRSRKEQNHIQKGWDPDFEFSASYFNHIQTNAAARGRVFEVTPQYLHELYVTQQGKCALSGVKILFPKNAKHRHGTLHCRASLDRKEHLKAMFPGMSNG